MEDRQVRSFRVTRRGLLLLTLAAASSLAGVAAPAQAPTPRKDLHVVLISLDGFAGFYLDDPRVPLPNIRRLAQEGARVDRLTVVTPSVTWPNHTTLVTGVYPEKHHVLANGRIEPGTGDRPLFINPRRSKEELCRFPTLYDAAHEAGLKTAEVNWPVTRGAPSLDWSFPDHPDPIRYGTPSLVQEAQRLGILPADDAAFRALGPVARDEAWTRLAAHLIRRHRPNLLLLHLLNTDGTQHQHGPSTVEATTALALADRHVGDVLDALRDAGVRDRSAVFVTADHGFATVTKAIRPNVRLRAAGLIRPEAGQPDRLEWDAQAIPEGGVALVYVPKGQLQPELRARVRQALAGLEGVADILSPEEYRPLGLPLPNRSPQAPDFLLTARDGYSFQDAVTGEEVVALPRPAGTHGYVHTNPRMEAALVGSGVGIRRGVRLSRAQSVDVAPTLARLLGLTLRDVDGQVLAAFFE